MLVQPWRPRMGDFANAMRGPRSPGTPRTRFARVRCCVPGERPPPRRAGHFTALKKAPPEARPRHLEVEAPQVVAVETPCRLDNACKTDRAQESQLESVGFDLRKSASTTVQPRTRGPRRQPPTDIPRLDCTHTHWHHIKVSAPSAGLAIGLLLSRQQVHEAALALVPGDWIPQHARHQLIVLEAWRRARQPSVPGNAAPPHGGSAAARSCHSPCDELPAALRARRGGGPCT